MNEKITITLSLKEINSLRLAAIGHLAQIDHGMRMSIYHPTQYQYWAEQRPAAQEALGRIARTQQAHMDAIGAGR